MKVAWIAAGAAALLMTGCVASTKATQQTTRSLVTYKITGASYETIADAVTKGLQGTNASSVRVDRSFPPAILPAAPSRLELKSPFSNSNLGVLAGASGQRMQLPSCPDAPYIATGADNSMSRYGEETGYYVCLWPYQQGINLDIYTSFEIESGGLANLGQDLARSVLGDSSQHIQKSINEVVRNIENTGASIEKVGELKS
jgi:hypothetical protein